MNNLFLRTKTNKDKGKREGRKAFRCMALPWKSCLLVELSSVLIVALFSLRTQKYVRDPGSTESVTMVP